MLLNPIVVVEVYIYGTYTKEVAAVLNYVK